jgi:hypothetical protein
MGFREMPLYGKSSTAKGYGLPGCQALQDDWHIHFQKKKWAHAQHGRLEGYHNGMATATAWEYVLLKS